MKEQIHELRTRIDGLAQLAKSIEGYSLTVVDVDKDVFEWPILDPSDWLKDCHKSLLLSKAWLGKVLAELGEETPYKNEGNRKTVEDIEPTADKSLPIELKVQLNEMKPIGASVRDINYIEKIDYLRQEIQKIYFIIFAKKVSNSFADKKEFLIDQPFDKCMEHLTEARFHLGFELQRIKEQSK